MQYDKSNLIKFINYKTLSLWDVKRYMQNHISLKDAVKLKDILHPFFKPVTKAELSSNNWQIISKINFAGELFLRDKNETETFKGNLKIVNSDSLIYSKINVRHGCIYYHSENSTPFAVSSEYPTYKVDSTKIFGKYLVMVIQSNYFKSILSKRATGISKARVKPSEFLETEIPVPELHIQERLLRIYETRINEANDLENNAIQIEKGIDVFLMKSLGTVIKQEKNCIRNKYQYLKFVNILDVCEWGIDIITKKQKREFLNIPL